MVKGIGLLTLLIEAQPNKAKPVLAPLNKVEFMIIGER